MEMPYPILSTRTVDEDGPSPLHPAAQSIQEQQERNSDPYKAYLSRNRTRSLQKPRSQLHLGLDRSNLTTLGLLLIDLLP